MISYHPTLYNGRNANAYGSGFKVVDTNDVHRIAKGISKYVWSPIVWKDGHRKQENFISCEWCALDFDTPYIALDQAIKNFCDIDHVIGTTKSHGIEKGGIVADRYRVVLRFSEPITDLRTYRYNMNLMLEKYDDADKACKDGARFFYVCSEIKSVVSGCDFVDVIKSVPDNFEKYSFNPKLIGKRRLNRTLRQIIQDGVPSGSRNNFCYGIAKDLTLCGFSKEEIIAMILSSDMYGGKSVGAEVMGNIEKNVLGGIKDSRKTDA